MRVLLVEDDLLLGDGIQVGLAQMGYAVDWMTDGESAEIALRAETFDVLVLDWNLPGTSGLGVLKNLRNRGDALPVLMLTARDTVADRVKGLDQGADDYLIKPFDLFELAARLRALVRRKGGREAPLLKNGSLTLDPGNREVTLSGKPIEISRREFAVLQAFMENPGRVLTKSRLEEALYGWNPDVESNTVEVFVHHLRRKLGADAIRTVRGVGYVMEKS
jgi:DNA-binding response OmpR family regulator